MKQMNYYYVTALFLFIIGLFSCTDNNEYLTERIEYLNQTPFSQSVISDINKFNSIEVSLIENMEEFLEGKKEQKISYKKEESINKFYFKGEKQPNLPKYLSKVEKLLSKLGEKGNVVGVNLQKDSSVMFVIRSTYISECLSNLNENLLKDKKYKINVNNRISTAKDTLLSNDWVYRINVDRRYGW